MDVVLNCLAVAYLGCLVLDVPITYELTEAFEEVITSDTIWLSVLQFAAYVAKDPLGPPSTKYTRGKREP